MDNVSDPASQMGQDRFELISPALAVNFMAFAAGQQLRLLLLVTWLRNSWVPSPASARLHRIAPDCVVPRGFSSELKEESTV
jgi:hypothetical protein